MKVTLFGNKLSSLFTYAEAPVETIDEKPILGVISHPYAHLTADELTEQIHNEFDTSFDNKKNEIADMLALMNIPVEAENAEKARRLQKLGFKKASVVKQVAKENAKIHNEKLKEDSYRKTLEEFQKLQVAYPFSKLITFDELKSICKKYSLVYTRVDAYIKDVPDKNLSEIENRQRVQREHIPESEIWVRVEYEGRVIRLHREITEGYKKLENPLEYDLERLRSGNGSCLSRYGFKETIWINKVHIQERTKEGLFICAPIDHFDLKDLESDDDFGYAKTTAYDIKDPVVFEFLKGGYCKIVSKWGLSSDDELLQNSIEN